jgi:hypothetical protein
VRITPSCVHDERSRVFAHGLCESFGTLLDNNVAPSNLTRERSVKGCPIRTITALELGNDDIILKAWLAGLAFDGASIDCEVTKVCKEFLCTVLALHQLEELRGIIDELM